MFAIRNRMGTDDFETFFRKYKAILRKHATLELSTVPECNPTVIAIDTMANNAVSLEAEYGLVPAAYLALQCNPVGLWYMYQQTGKYRSQFVGRLQIWQFQIVSIGKNPLPRCHCLLWQWHFTL